MSKKIEIEKVTIEVPKPIMDFLKAIELNSKQYLQRSLLEVIKSDIQNTSGIFGCSQIFQRYGLEDVFKAMKISAATS